jgi:tRNA pseudouridine32 synthase/23S rRNA pseudouridine746 synthase
MNSIGLPLINDQFYPQVLKHANELDEFNAPLQLLAQTIALKDPVTGASRSFASSRQLNASR